MQRAAPIAWFFSLNPAPEGRKSLTLVYDPSDPIGKMFFNILATISEFEADLIRMTTREGMAIARAKGKLRGKQTNLSDKQQHELCRIHTTGEYSITDLAEVFLCLGQPSTGL